MPYGYAVLVGWPKDARAVMHRIARQNIIPVEGTFEEVGELIREVADRGDVVPSYTDVRLAPAPATGKDLTIAGGRLKLSEENASVYSESFDVISDSDLTVEPRSDDAARARSFLRGEDLGWVPYAKGWAFKGTAYKHVRESLKSELERAKKVGGGILLVHGSAGLGKSIMAHQIAFDCFAELRLPVLFAKSSWMTRPDFRLLDRFFQDLEDEMPENESAPLTVLVIDRAELIERSVAQRAVSYLRSRGRPILVVLFARTNEFFRETLMDSELPERWGDPLEVALADRIPAQDVAALVKHVSGLGAWDTKRITDPRFWTEYVDRELEARYFDAFYSIVEQTQEPLRERVWSEFANLSGGAKEAYLLIAGIHQFGLSLKMEILMRALNASFADFEREIIKSDAREVLFTEHQTSELNIFFRGRSPIISKIIFDRALPARGSQLDYFRRIIAAVNPSEIYGLDELDMLRTLMVQILGPSGSDKRFAEDEVSALFELATRVVEDDVLEHHYGLAERNAKRPLSAREHLEKAIALSETLPYDLASLRESRQNIENSLAQVIGDLAMEAAKRGERVSAIELFADAERHFRNARTGSFPNVAAYDAHARLLWRWATRLHAQGQSDRNLLLAQALDVIGDGLSNVSQDLRIGLVDLQTNILTELGLDAEAKRELEKLASQGDKEVRAQYEVMLGRVILGGTVDEAKPKRLRQALAHTASACELNPRYSVAWRLRAEIYKKLNPTDYSGLLDLLSRVSTPEDPGDNLWVLYESAVASFLLERYDQSFAAFGALRRASRGHPSRSGILELAGTRGGEEPLEFLGRTVKRNSDGALVILSEELARFGEIWFNPRAQRFYMARYGDRVSFVVGFNYTGLMADELRRL